MRTIKSFVMRGGRISNRQQQALDCWLKEFELPSDNGLWDFEQIFKRKADVIVEIGFGMGHSLLLMAKGQPDCDFIGIEVHRAGVGSLAADLHEQGIDNVAIASHDAVEVFKNCIPDHSLAGIQIFFPDPWPKKKHHKRRLIQADFIRLLTQKLKPGGFVHCATDWQEYAEHMLSVLSAEPQLHNTVESGFSPRPAHRPLTKFEQRGCKLGHGVWDLIFKKQ
ncbi:tRNA (guanosine(46)-N7)-methyltransferase TrmB [Legionella jordanis]|uniref:tRNA (guanine-N(7)-)-methyltransferase n=1 Tax=Legionella jordanis TaxID=456 RepID=A0A0W0VCM4_9GAMM|nr:tRNA (guanosine(46)-N7)-methyltransferase TrmB [Legionella jordanis]KTD17353.1 tRNA (m7G46) methyltransferase, SAM-dependent [Legionella jordanis]RMX01879.1 tRNA (guanosine(46)-N7)-methyltransferase TrmB [Legionella jordanis]RMX17669.1 tRNA (guanosine(46)-N7)-methyltransferase TrmB [Legionella jordanis]VEH11630.1 tRNA (m7G46) methyltransferase, SAM-dependent [Legionella jordanis]HAT8712992.1 tRNA (guanosine(46)-N7)-methyltransferase TrmB [Legionella jordanis]